MTKLHFTIPTHEEVFPALYKVIIWLENQEYCLANILLLKRIRIGDQKDHQLFKRNF